MKIPADPSKNAQARILVVDDAEFNRELMAQELEEEGHLVEVAASGAECLEMAAANHPDVILLDIQMPEMDGIETCRRLKENSETKHIPVLFITAKRTDEASVVEALAAGGNDFLPKPYSPAILFARVACQVTIARQHAKLMRMAMVDELTGVATRRHLFDSLHRTVKAQVRQGPDCLSLLVLDVDHFKKVNDEQGHLEGDRVLKNVAAVIAAQVRDTDLVARFGGEEFVVVLPRTANPGATEVAEKIRAAIQAECNPVTISIGVATAGPLTVEEAKEGAPVENLITQALKAADDMVYQAKESGRNRVCTTSLGGCSGS
jgi:diguanylate cyclase (GGDEF)-like protein